MATARQTLEVILRDLSRGYAEMALLGSSPKTEMPLESRESLTRYTEMMRPNIAAALERSRTTEWFIYVLLVLLFATAITLTILANLRGWGWIASASTIPGLGVTAVWPIQTLIRLRRENLKLSLVMESLPLLNPKDAADFIKKLFFEDAQQL